MKGSGKGGRDAVHFMYHNDNGQGYIRMAEGTKPPRKYKRPVYLALDPSFWLITNYSWQRMVLFYFMATFLFSTSTSRNNSPQYRVTLFIRDVVILYLHQLQVAHGIQTLHGNMLWRRKAQVLFLGQMTFLMKSESQHGSSWVSKFHKTMENWFLALHYATRRILTLE